nr:hypothetical protein GCM10025732_29090 [Glycomyces mayteni]
MRRRARGAAVDVPRVVLDAVAGAGLLHVLQVEHGAHPQPLGLQELPLGLQLREALFELDLDVADGALEPGVAGGVVRAGEDEDPVDLADRLAGDRVQVVQPVDLVAKHLDADRQLLVGRDDLDRVAADPEGAAGEGDVVAGVLDVHQAAQQLVAFPLLADGDLGGLFEVLGGRGEAVDGRDRGDHDDVAAGEQRVRSAVAQPLDLLVDRGVLLDVGVGLGDVRLGLVVVVVGDVVLDGVVRQELAELLRQLRGEGLVVDHHQGRPLEPLDQPRGRGGLAGAGGAEQHGVALAAADPVGELRDRGRLVAGGPVLADHLEAPVGARNIESHGPTVTPGSDTPRSRR